MANSPRVIGDPRLMMDVPVDLRLCVGRDRQGMVRAERLGDWMGTGGRSPRMTWRRSAVSQTGCGAPSSLVRRPTGGAGGPHPTRSAGRLPRPPERRHAEGPPQLSAPEVRRLWSVRHLTRTVGGLDVHRRQITSDHLDERSGQSRRAPIAPADRMGPRCWLTATMTPARVNSRYGLPKLRAERLLATPPPLC